MAWAETSVLPGCFCASISHTNTFGSASYLLAGVLLQACVLQCEEVQLSTKKLSWHRWQLYFLHVLQAWERERHLENILERHLLLVYRFCAFYSEQHQFVLNTLEILFRLSSLRKVFQKKRHLNRTHWVLPPVPAVSQGASGSRGGGAERSCPQCPPALSLYLIKYWSGS